MLFKLSYLILKPFDLRIIGCVLCPHLIELILQISKALPPLG